MAPRGRVETMLLLSTPNSTFLSIQFTCLTMSLSSCKGQMIQQGWFNESSPKTPIGTWQSAVCNHQYTLWSVLVQKATLWYCIILGNFSADHEHHSSRSWACCSHSTWHSDHGTGRWTAHSESELCSPLPKQFWLATLAQQERVYAAVSNLYWLCHICWRNLPNRGKHWSQQESTMPWKLHPT